MRTHHSFEKGFSLVEMLIVLTVIGVLFAVAAPNLFNLMQTTSLTSEGSFVRNKLNQAQQLALSTNGDVEVRFFEIADEGAAETIPAFRAFQFFQFDGSGELTEVTPVFRIKPPVIIDESLSTLLKVRNRKTDEGEYGFISPTTGESPLAIGGDEKLVEYIAFRFRPDGSTDLPNGDGGGGDTWYLTLVSKGDSKGGGLPDNFFIIQVDPFNGSVSVFRP